MKPCLIGPNQPQKGTGYIRSMRNGVSMGDHQWAFLDAHGWLPEQVCHHCDNPPCHEITHLYDGTAKTNAEDREARGRGRQAKGERHNMAKLTDTQVLELRRLHATGDYTHRQLGAMFGITRQGAAAIIHRKLWGHLP